MLAELCNRLVAEGVPITGAILTVTSLDPVVARTRMRWEREGGRVLEEVLLHGMATGATAAESNSQRSAVPGTDYEIEWRSERARGFANEQRAYLDAVSVVMSAPLQVVVGRGLTRGLLQAYLGRRSAEKVLSGAVRRGIGETIEAVVWVSDLRDFTLLSETVSSDQIITALNDCCARLVGAIHPFGGEVLKFIGDGLLAIFPLAARGERAACDAAIAAVRAARQGMALLDAERIRVGLPALPFGVGLHLGAVVYGNIGAPDRLDFTAIGPTVNAASRIEGLCRSLGYPVLISEEVAGRCGSGLAPVGRYPLRGTARPVELFTLPELVS
ncbi:MAG TPA: adenylate/guanylate cyclase domain-containing protein [Candidatus Binataceae bacterium]|nr:adenylate/guanylate cyclase domain-containing protein [Candidatus Binataceae bacterium]